MRQPSVLWAMIALAALGTGAPHAAYALSEAGGPPGKPGATCDDHDHDGDGDLDGDDDAQCPEGQAKTPLKIRELAELRFGTLAVGAVGGTVTVSPTGTRTASGGVVLLPFSTGGPALFRVEGRRGSLYHISVSDRIWLHTSSVGPIGSRPPLMEVQTFTTSPASPGQLQTGVSTLQVGGVLRVNARQVSGPYTGNFHVTVEYE